MSEKNNNFMSMLDAWTEEKILRPMSAVLQPYFEMTEEMRGTDEKYDESLWHMDGIIKKAVREKVLESYRNGQAAKVKPQQKGRTWKRQ
jgi:hypothetical protein